MLMPKQNKYYIDASKFSDADAVARQVQAAFPKVRFGVGPAALNVNFEGDEGPIVAYLSNIAPLKQGESQAAMKTAETKRFVPAPPQSREEPNPFKEGDIVFVPSLGIEAKVKKVMPHGIVNLELADGITETMLAKNLEPVQKGATNLPPTTAATPPATPSNEASTPAPKAASAETPQVSGEAP